MWMGARCVCVCVKKFVERDVRAAQSGLRRSWDALDRTCNGLR